MKQKNIGKCIITIFIVILVANMACAGIIGNAIKLPIGDQVVQKQDNNVVGEEEEKVEEAAGGMPLAIQSESAKKSNGAICDLGSDCKSGYCKCVCKKEEATKEEVMKKTEETVKNDSNIEEKEEAIVKEKEPTLSIASLTAKLSLNLPELQIEEEQEEEIQEELAQEMNVISQEKEPEVAEIEEQVEEARQECKGVLECVCAPCESDANCGTGVCVEGVCKEEGKAEKKEAGEDCKEDSDCKSGKCETSSIGGFFGIGGVTQRKCVALTEEEEVEERMMVQQEQAENNAQLRTATIEALLKKLTPIEKKLTELENKAIDRRLTTQAELNQLCPGCYDLSSSRTQAALEEKKRKLKKRTAILNQILSDAKKIKMEQTVEVSNLVSVKKKKAAEQPVEEPSGFMRIFGFVTAITGNFALEFRMEDEPMTEEDMWGDNGMNMDEDMIDSGDDDFEQDTEPNPEGCDYDGVCEQALGETWQNCTNDCHCGDGHCQERVWHENVVNCERDCDVPEPVCGDGLCDRLTEGPNICPQDCPCGDGECDTASGENAINCPDDCGGLCGDGYCNVRERRSGSCPQDCCGDTICSDVESLEECPEDCARCGDGVCNLDETRNNCADCVECGDDYCDERWGEDAESCAVDCGECGDGTCSETENIGKCAVDCDVCGDGVCGASENMQNCFKDCGPVCGNEICEDNEDETCEDCRNKDYYRDILTQMFNSLASIEDTLCNSGAIGANACPIAWDGTISNQAEEDEGSQDEPDEQEEETELLGEGEACESNADCESGICESQILGEGPYQHRVEVCVEAGED